jgi:hypothetical protein
VRPDGRRRGAKASGAVGAGMAVVARLAVVEYAVIIYSNFRISCCNAWFVKSLYRPTM